MLGWSLPRRTHFEAISHKTNFFFSNFYSPTPKSTYFIIFAQTCICTSTSILGVTLDWLSVQSDGSDPTDWTESQSRVTPWSICLAKLFGWTDETTTKPFIGTTATQSRDWLTGVVLEQVQTTAKFKSRPFPCCWLVVSVCGLLVYSLVYSPWHKEKRVVLLSYNNWKH